MARKVKAKKEYPKAKYIYHPDDFTWHEKAACKNLPVEMFYYDDEERGEEKTKKEIAALNVCKSCPVKQTCLQDAINRKDSYSIQGGTTPIQRGYNQSDGPIQVVLVNLEGGTNNAKKETRKANRTLNG